MRTLTLKAVLIPALVLGALTYTPARAKADDLEDLLQGLLTVVVDIDRFNDLVYINDVDILDYNYVNVSDVLDDFGIEILSIVIDEVPILSFNQGLLDDILQFEGVLDGDQVVVGVLSDQGVIYYLENGGQ